MRREKVQARICKCSVLICGKWPISCVQCNLFLHLSLRAINIYVFNLVSYEAVNRNKVSMVNSHREF
jgi:hypothetical protein